MAATWHIGLRQELPGLLRSCRESLSTLAQSRAFLAVLCIVALVDGGLLGLALATVYGDSEQIELPAWFYLNAEFSFGEIWEYCLSAAAAVGLLWRYRRFREPIIGCLGLVFVWLTLDNALALHEATGHMVSPLFVFAEHSQPSPQDYGELLSFGVIGGIILLELWLTGLRSERHSVIQSLAIITMLAGAAFFGVCFDFLDQAIANQTQTMKSVLSFIEDGAELLLLSIAATIAMTARLPAAQE
ncbi:MAG: hypothetical protein P8J20_01260 [Novosphingobium sp.]|nr:hypothetical protein [Novosphingobium sp.]